MSIDVMSHNELKASVAVASVNDRDDSRVGSAGQSAVSVRNVSKMYSLYADPRDRLKQSLWYALPHFLRGRPREFFKEFWALHDVSFELKRGEALGIIGRNGSGKSTLLQIIAGTLTPTGGEIETRGRVAALLELGSGFNTEFTGRENVYLNGSILGFSREEMDERFDDIVAFADIGDFIDQPVKHYSSGMFVRLAFAVQACVEPDILIVDEALAVGDIFFQQKCHARMEELMANDTAIIIVSHDMHAIERYSSQAILLEQGKCLILGRPEEAIYSYYNLIEKEYRATSQVISNAQVGNEPVPVSEFDSILDWPPSNLFLDLSEATIVGSEEIAKCTGVALFSDKHLPRSVFHIGDVAHFYLEFELLKDIEVPVGGVNISDSLNVLIHGANSLQYLSKAPNFVKKGSRVRFKQTIRLAIAPGEYSFMVGLATTSTDAYARTMADNGGDYPFEDTVTILRVVQAGKIMILPRTAGIGVPFYGSVDLEGSCIVSIL